MPFRKPSSSGRYSQNDSRSIFVGRTSELEYFVENILRPEYPACNIVSVSGNGGVGKSTLLARFREVAHVTDNNGCNVTALVDERHVTAANMMERFADQLRAASFPLTKFDRELDHYKDAVRKLQVQHEDSRNALLHGAADIAASVAKDVPVVGTALSEGTRVFADFAMSEYRHHQMMKDAARLEDPIADLTNAFVEDLNHLPDAQNTVFSKPAKVLRRVILFFDTFEQTSLEAAPWLLDYFLEADLEGHIVLVIAGRDPIERSIPNDPKRWLSYLANGTIHQISLDSFNREETSIYLGKRGIAQPKQLSTIWQLSRGLPLYLGLLTSNPNGDVDPTLNVVANFLRWIPENEKTKRQLALDASLLSRPFNQDDLRALPYVSSDNIAEFYSWLINQPFVICDPQDWRHTYHDMARHLFRRYVYQQSTNEYYETIRNVAKYYEGVVKEIDRMGNRFVNDNGRMEAVLALSYQLLSLPDSLSRIRSIGYLYDLIFHSSPEQTTEVMRFLRGIVNRKTDHQIRGSSLNVCRKIIQFIDNDMVTKEFLDAATYAINAASDSDEVLKHTMALLHKARSEHYGISGSYSHAIDDLSKALEYEPDDAHTYARRCMAHRLLGRYQEALDDINRALEIGTKTIHREAEWIGERGTINEALNHIDDALDDYKKAVELSSGAKKVHWISHLGNLYTRLQRFDEALAQFDNALDLSPNTPSVLANRGRAYRRMGSFDLAVADLSLAIDGVRENDKSTGRWRFERGLAYAALGLYQDAGSDFNYAIDSAPNDSALFYYLTCRGQLYRDRGHHTEALADYIRASNLNGPSRMKIRNDVGLSLSHLK